MMLAMYEETVYPLPIRSTWNVPTQVTYMLVLPSRTRIQPERPKKRRHKTAWENKSEHNYGTCGYYGHNKKNCRYKPQNIWDSE